MSVLIYVISGICRLLILLICLEAIMSWFVPQMPYQMVRFFGLLQSITEPVVRPFRGISQRFAYSWGIDFSPLLAILVIELVQKVLIAILIQVFY